MSAVLHTKRCIRCKSDVLRTRPTHALAVTDTEKAQNAAHNKAMTAINAVDAMLEGREK